MTVTPTPTTSGESLPPAYLLIEPQSINATIGNYMNNNGSTFFGFTNSDSPSVSSDLQTYLNFYSTNAGSGGVPSIITQTIPQSSGGVDVEGNAIVQYNFTTTEVPGGTVLGNAWYTWLIPDDSIGGTSSGNRQLSIDYSNGNGPNTFTIVNMTSVIYGLSVTNPGGSFANGTYRMYTTYAIQNFKLDNTINTIYFKGNTIA
jgi:hypothetical protein